MLVNMSGGKKVENIINEIVEPVLLWTNPDPTSNFQYQTVNVDGTDYDGYIVEIRNHISDNSTAACFVPKSTQRRLIAAYNNSASVIYGWREILSATDTTVGFAFGGYINSNIYSMVEDTKYGVPTRIWGVKFTL